jgi:predicted phage terminase large subunit-like protein
MTTFDQELLANYVLNNNWIPHRPFVQQGVFLGMTGREALYGGAAGGGKSDALLMGALMFCEIPGYNAILFRKSYSDLKLPEAIMDRSHDWLASTAAKWNGEDYRWTFPSGATLNFGYMNLDKDKFRYQSSAYQYVGFDELTQFPADHYLYMFSRLRRLVTARLPAPLGIELPIRMRAGTNPGGIGNDWVYERFIVDGARPFVPAKLDDNPHIDQEEYRENLRELDDTTRKQLEDGLWVVDPLGKPFSEDWYRSGNRFFFDERGRKPIGRWISWDTALSEKETAAYSAAVVVEIQSDYSAQIVDVFRDRLSFPDLPDKMAELFYKWDHDSKCMGIIIEGQASGKPAIQTLRRSLDPRLAASVFEFIPKGDKVERANRAAVWAKRGLVKLPWPGQPETEDWQALFERELFNFPETMYKDQVDALAQGLLYLENYLTTAWHGAEAKKRQAQKHSRVEKALRKKKKY